MSRSNGPVTRAGSHQQDWPPAAEPDLPDPSHHPHRWPSLFPQQAPARHSQPAAQPDRAHQAPGEAPAYHYPQDHYPQENYSQGHYPQGDYPQEHYEQDGYAPDARNAHQPFTPVRHPPFFSEQSSPQRPQPSPYGSAFEELLASQHQEQAAPGYYDDQGLSQLQPPGQARRARTTLRDQLQATQQSNQWQQPNPAPRSHDPRGYDLGSYMPNAADADPPGFGNGHASGRDGHLDPHWPDPHGYGYGADPGARPSSAADYYAQLGGESLPVEQGQEFDPDSDEFEDYEYEETGNRRRGLLIVGALVGAIMVGGGLAYGYKTIVGPAPKGGTPVIKADARPAKSQPEDPGGRQFAHSDSKLLGRLDTERSTSNSLSGSARASTLDDTDESGVRRVPTIVVGRDGSIAPPAQPKLPPNSGSDSNTVAVPGMTIVNGFGGRPTVQPQRNEAPEQSPEVPAAPRIIARASPEPQSSAPAPRATPPTPPLPVRSANVLPPSSRRAAAPPRTSQPAPRQLAPRQVAANPAPPSEPGGYVAVLASQQSRIDALKTFADLQQQYNSVLRNKIPDVLEADLSSRGLGTMYRVVVGPPGSREAASDLCGQLKSAGFEGCWITAY